MLAPIWTFIAKMRNVVPMEKRNKKVVFFFILTVTMLDNLNVSSAFISSTNIQQKFRADSTKVTWVVAAYALTLGSFIVLFGKIGDIIGVHNVFLLGAMGMSLFSLIVAVIEKSIIALIVFRALQGMSGAAIIPSAFGLAANYFEGPQLGMALKFIIISITASIGFGMILGGAFSETNIGYKGFYYLSFAISFVSSIVLFFTIIPAKETEARRAMKIRNLDFVATSGIVVGMLLIILGFTEGGVNWKTPKAYIPLPIGILVLIFVFTFELAYIGRYQNKYPDSDNWKSKLLMIFPFEILSLPNFWNFLINLMAIYLSYISCNLILVNFHTYVVEDSGILTGVKIFPLSAGVVCMALSFRFPLALQLGYKKCLIASNFIQAMMTIWLSRLDYAKSRSYWKFEFVPLFLFGAASNIYFQVYLNVIMSSAPLHLQANVSGIFQTSTQIGISLGSAITSTFIGNISKEIPKDKLQNKITNALYFSVAASATGFCISLFSNGHAYKPSAGLPKSSHDNNPTESENIEANNNNSDPADIEMQAPNNVDKKQKTQIESST